MDSTLNFFQDSQPLSSPSVGPGSTPLASAPLNNGMANGMGFLSVGMGIFSALSDIEAGKQQKKAYQYNAAENRNNATIAMYEGEQQGRTLQLQGEHVMGQAAAGYGAAGVTSSGSVIDVENQIANEAARNVANAHLNARLSAMRFQDQANLDDYSGKIAEKASQTKALGDFASSAMGAMKMFAAPGVAA